VRIIGGIEGLSDNFFKYRRAVDDVGLWDSEVMGVARTKNEVCITVFEE